VHTGMPGMQENLEKEERNADTVPMYDRVGMSIEKKTNNLVSSAHCEKEGKRNHYFTKAMDFFSQLPRSRVLLELQRGLPRGL